MLIVAVPSKQSKVDKVFKDFECVGCFFAEEMCNSDIYRDGDV